MALFGTTLNGGITFDGYANIGQHFPHRMAPDLKRFLQRWLINTLAVLVAVLIVPGIKYDRALDLFVASLLLGILNAFVRPVLMLLALPLVISTLGLFILVINGLMLYFVAFLLPGFHVSDFWSAVWGALIIGLVSLAVNTLAGTRRSRLQFKWRRRPPDSPHDDGNGPVIDV